MFSTEQADPTIPASILSRLSLRLRSITIIAKGVWCVSCRAVIKFVRRCNICTGLWNKGFIMQNDLSRRTFVTAVPSICAASLLIPEQAKGEGQAARNQRSLLLDPHLLSQDPKRVKETVGVSHGNLPRVRELVEASPALAKAAWDWGFGDWETALGAASHTGNREIAELLIAHGARPDIFTFAMFGQLGVVKACVEANPGIQRTHGPHGITLLSHAHKGGDRALPVVEYLKTLGDADIGYTSLPLSEEEKKIYLGAYSFGPGPENQIEVGIRRDGALDIKRGADGSPRGLFYQGKNEFHPAGAPAVRIRFDVKNDRASQLTISDPEPILIARRETS